MDRKLNNNQIQNLKTVLKFRYVTTDNLANTHSITTNSGYSALEILTKAGYLQKIYEKSYRLLNKSPVLLSQKALGYLHDQPDIQLLMKLYGRVANLTAKKPQTLSTSKLPSMPHITTLKAALVTK